MINVIKEVCANYISYANLADVVFGTVVTAAPILMKIDNASNLQIGEPFVILTDRFKEKPLKAKDRVVMLKASGGQTFVVLDKLKEG
jgi:hypothetical protein